MFVKNDKLTLLDLFKSIILNEKSKSINIFELIDKIKQTYNLNIKKNVMINYIKMSDMYFDETNQKIYINYNEWTREIEWNY